MRKEDLINRLEKIVPGHVKLYEDEKEKCFWITFEDVSLVKTENECRRNDIGFESETGKPGINLIKTSVIDVDIFLKKFGNKLGVLYYGYLLATNGYRSISGSYDYCYDYYYKQFRTNIYRFMPWTRKPGTIDSEIIDPLCNTYLLYKFV